MTGPGVGVDYALLDDTSSQLCFIAGVGYSDRDEYMAYIRAVNNISTAGARSDRIMVSLQAGQECEEQRVRTIMKRLTDIARNEGVAISGGNTVISGDGQDCTITITAYGKTSRDTLKQLNVKPVSGDKIIIIGDAGAYGVYKISSIRHEKLRERFSEGYLSSICEPELRISRICEALIRGGVLYIHDVSYGGIYRALVELAEYSGLGIDVMHAGIPIRQSTIEVCEYVNINPYELIGTGGVVALCRESQLGELCEVLDSEGIEYSVAGELSDSGERIVHSEDYRIRRNLNYYEGDMIYKVL